ncbi:unnamed protein product [Amoebophrya sp. A25]|nr:unnamed protein product [Amoebophrya sp. A25]|eukprot:GSA25T00012887001.1
MSVILGGRWKELAEENERLKVQLQIADDAFEAEQRRVVHLQRDNDQLLAQLQEARWRTISVENDRKSAEEEIAHRDEELDKLALEWERQSMTAEDLATENCQLRTKKDLGNTKLSVIKEQRDQLSKKLKVAEHKICMALEHRREREARISSLEAETRAQQAGILKKDTLIRSLQREKTSMFQDLTRLRAQTPTNVEPLQKENAKLLMLRELHQIKIGQMRAAAATADVYGNPWGRGTTTTPNASSAGGGGGGGFITSTSKTSATTSTTSTSAYEREGSTGRAPRDGYEQSREEPRTSTSKSKSKALTSSTAAYHDQVERDDVRDQERDLERDHQRDHREHREHKKKASGTRTVVVYEREDRYKKSPYEQSLRKSSVGKGNITRLKQQQTGGCDYSMDYDDEEMNHLPQEMNHLPHRNKNAFMEEDDIHVLRMTTRRSRDDDDPHLQDHDMVSVGRTTYSCGRTYSAAGNTIRSHAAPQRTSSTAASNMLVQHLRHTHTPPTSSHPAPPPHAPPSPTEEKSCWKT